MNSTAVREANKRRLLVGKLFLIVGAMFLFGYALVPLYNVFCDITGLNGKTKNAPVVTTKAGNVDTSRTITVELLANVNSQLAWEFQSEVRKVQVHPGEPDTLCGERSRRRQSRSTVCVGKASPPDSC
jgi:cytochrome c oxidase assembly protein subunit 11